MYFFDVVLDYRFMDSVFKSVPQVTLQMYIMFTIAITEHTYSLVVMISAAISIVSLASVLTLLYERKEIRLISMAPEESNPAIARYIARMLSCIGIGSDGETVQEITNFNVSLSSLIASEFVI